MRHVDRNEHASEVYGDLLQGVGAGTLTTISLMVFGVPAILCVGGLLVWATLFFAWRTK